MVFYSRMLFTRSVLLFVSLTFLFACDSQSVSSEQQGKVCLQVNAFIDSAENGPPLSPRDWGNLMLAGARLIYATNQCGDRVTESRDELCANVRNAMQVFVTNPMVPAGKNRDAAIQTSSAAYERAQCEPPLDVN